MLLGIEKWAVYTKFALTVLDFLAWNYGFIQMLKVKYQKTTFVPAPPMFTEKNSVISLMVAVKVKIYYKVKKLADTFACLHFLKL